MQKSSPWRRIYVCLKEYKDLWTLYFGHCLAAMTETMNLVVKFAVAVLVDDDVVGHR